jgi:DNA-binding transcriptional ArsR family regulator
MNDRTLQAFGNFKKDFLDIFPYRNTISHMARSPTTLDSFSAIAEPKRRDVINVLADGSEISVGGIVKTLGWPQPQVSKHLRVLLEVGLVKVRREGRRQMYTLNAEELKPIHEWVKTFERLWSHHLERIKIRAEAKAQSASSTKPSQIKGESHG